MKKEVAIKKKQDVQLGLFDKMGAVAGAGVSTKQEDNLVPLVYVLQALSKCVNKRSPEYIEGAEAGSIWLRNAASPIVDGEEGILFQPCYFSKDWVEWIPREKGGGYVGRHEECPADATKIADPQNPNKLRWVRPNGNDVIETRYHAGFVIREDGSAMPYIIPFSSSGHTVSRQWTSTMNSFQLPDGRTAPSFGRVYRLRTRERSNAAGTWFLWDVGESDWVDSEEAFDRGLALYNSFSRGEKQMAEPELETSGDRGSVDQI